METLFEKHEELLQLAVKAIHQRRFYTPYPEHHKAYPAQQHEEAKKWFEQQKGSRFSLSGVNAVEWYGEEESPFTQEKLDVAYPWVSTEVIVSNASQARKALKQISVNQRAGFLVEVLEQMKEHYFQLALSTEHTSGQSFMMAFQASGPHSADRALEATALAWQELKRFPQAVEWEKPMGKLAIELQKEFKPIGRGVGLVIGCSTFPVWNSIPGIFANLMAGNPVIVKPHSGAVLPMAILIEIIRKLATTVGTDPNIIQLAIDKKDAPRAVEFMNHEAIELIDFTGSSAFGDEVEKTNKITFTEKSGVNSVLLDSVIDINAVLQNLAFSSILYSGQMCTSPQNFFVPEDELKVGNEHLSFDAFVELFKKAVSSAVNNPKIGPGTLAAIQSEKTAHRVESQNGASIDVTDEIAEILKGRRFSVPTINVLDQDDSLYREELFGPIVNIIRVPTRQKGLEIMTELIKEKGCITTACYTQDDSFKAVVKDQLEDVGANVSFNLTGYIWVNQASAFSDFHVTGGNPAGNASFVNPEFVVKRFFWVGHRELK